MTFYIKALFIAIPIFSFFIALEAIVAKYRGLEINRSADMISSLSSGLTNILRDGVKFSVLLISYSWIASHISIFKVEPVWIAVVVAVIVQDFSGYWMHRITHRVNIFWNRHVIHHSSEEFNLSCALRQSISNTFKFQAVFMFPAAIMGIPPEYFVIIGPIHLFMQLWYHTQLIGKMGFLEYIIVTPSHHRVHHAINPEYIDKNYSQVFIIWDKLFGTFAREEEDNQPVYGVLKPVRTWNPVLINFKHAWQLMQDAWHSQGIWDKIRIWFMPTGWRPAEIKEKYPVELIEDPSKQSKFSTNNSLIQICFCWMQLMFTSVFIFHLFITMDAFNTPIVLLYGAFILLHVFSYTSVLDMKQYAFLGEIGKLSIAIYLLSALQFTWFGLDGIYVLCFSSYLLISFAITFYILNIELKHYQSV